MKSHVILARDQSVKKLLIEYDARRMKNKYSVLDHTEYDARQISTLNLFFLINRYLSKYYIGISIFVCKYVKTK